MDMARMDETNLRILQLLQNNARISLVEVAKAVGRSESTVRERVAALEMDGVVQRYEARVDWAKAGLPASAVVRARCDLGQVAEATRHLASIPNVTRALLLTGPKPIMALLRVRDRQHLYSLLSQRLANGILKDIEAEIALDSLIEQRPPAIFDPNQGGEPAAAAAPRAPPPPARAPPPRPSLADAKLSPSNLRATAF